ncbi:MAG: molybdopterin-dependent oxidoreductase [Burkholderiales bacterium]|nr:molybdopterin-dependent oxidoreductase [Burkholderiales bacterium]
MTTLTAPVPPSLLEGFATDLSFSVNGVPIVMRDVDPTALLVDWLRSPDVGLTGTKIGCKQGGCGACTVVLSHWNEATRKVEHSSINSCLRPLASLDGMLITTVEGTGSVKADCISEVQECLALNNGTQCGYCTPGWIMNMTAAVAQCGRKPGTKAQIEELFDGNICRCTGYRPILYGFKKRFASDWNPVVDEHHCMTCIVDPAEQVGEVAPVNIAFPNALQKPPRPVAYAVDGYRWYRPVTLDGLLKVLQQFPDRANVRLVGGNTSIGIYPRTVENPHVFIDIAQIPELRDMRGTSTSLRLGGALTYRELISVLDDRIAATSEAGEADKASLPALNALRHMAGRTAGTIVRNAATLAGNTMLVVRHAEEGVPFPSDCFTALAALGTKVAILTPSWNVPREMDLLDFAAQWQASPDLKAGCVLVRYDVRMSGKDEYVQTYKTALREVNAHSIVNAGLRVRLDARQRVGEATLVFGGLTPVAQRMPLTEAALIGHEWNPATLERALKALGSEVDALFERDAARYAQLPDEGFSREYRRQLAESYLFKFYVEVRNWRHLPVPPAERSAADRPVRPVSHGTQAYVKYPAEYPGNLPFIKIEAYLQTTGEAIYTHDIPLPRRGLNGAPVQSTVALGSCVYAVPGIDGPATPAQVLAALRQKYPSVVDYVTAIDVPGPVFEGMAGDDPVFAVSVQVSQCPDGKLPADYDVSAPMWLSGFGQCIGMVLAENEQVAQEAAWMLQNDLCVFKAQKPLLDIPPTDVERNSIVFLDKPATAPWYSHIWKITREGSHLGWVPPREPDKPDPVEPVVAKDVQVPDGKHGLVRCTRVSSTQKVGSQIHFYMETQSTFAEVLEDRQMCIHSSTQDPNTVQGGVASALMLPLNKVDVRVRRVGGGYGGKCGQSVFPAVMASVAAWKTNRSVRLAPLRQVDTAMFGHRHSGLGNYNIAIGDASNPATHGKITGYQADYWLDGGRTYDCSFVISDCMSLRSDSAYSIPNWNCVSDVCRTNKTTNSSMRTVGMLQGALIVEDAIEAAAHSVGMLAEDVRALNLYMPGETTPYGEPLPSCYMKQVWDYTMEKSNFRSRLAAVETFNAQNRWRKRGISLIPVKYGSGFNLTMLEQGGALIEVYDQDGTVLVRHGGIEMGQGLNTKMAQVVAVALNVPMGIIRVAENDTAVVPNPESTGASTGTSFNGKAAQKACGELRKRLEQFCFRLLAAEGADWCRSKHVNFWDYPEGWRATVPDNPKQTLWQSIVSQAFAQRVNLSAQARVRIVGGGKSDTGLEFKIVDGQPATEPVDYFNGYTFSAACTEVEIDVLTGETTILRSDVVYDAGHSLNPAVDVGQVEGGFVQGLGYVTSEELTYQPADSPVTPSATRPAPGSLYTVNTWEYKPPAAQSIPVELNVMMFPRELAPASPDPGDVLSSKEIGEPPMTLAVSAFFAIKKAVMAARKDRGCEGWFQMEAPATVERVQEAISQVGFRKAASAP